jgi:hypothetical protein
MRRPRSAELKDLTVHPTFDPGGFTPPPVGGAGRPDVKIGTPRPFPQRSAACWGGGRTSYGMAPRPYPDRTCSVSRCWIRITSSVCDCPGNRCGRRHRVRIRLDRSNLAGDGAMSEGVLPGEIPPPLALAPALRIARELVHAVAGGMPRWMRHVHQIPVHAGVCVSGVGVDADGEANGGGWGSIPFPIPRRVPVPDPAA